MVAGGGLPTVSVEAAGLMVTATLLVVMLAGLLESVAATLSVTVPLALGVPVTVQLVLNVRPLCSVPDFSAQV